MDKKKKNTIILIAIVLVVALGALISQRFLFYTPGTEVVVASQEKEIMRLDLNEDQEVTVDAPDGGYNIITIQDGMVSVTESDCPNQICVHQGKIHESFELIVCLPHELVITIEEHK